MTKIKVNTVPFPHESPEGWWHNRNSTAVYYLVSQLGYVIAVFYPSTGAYCSVVADLKIDERTHRKMPVGFSIEITNEVDSK